MKSMFMFLLVIFLIICFVLNIMGLMFLIPIYITSPLLFLSLLGLLSYVNNRKKFKGFH